LRKFALPLLALLASCTSMTGPSPTALADGATPMISPILTTADAHDPFTYAEPEVARVTHVALDLALDFKAKRVSGSATLDILAAAGADQVILDSDGLDIASITDASGKKLAFTVGAQQAGKGAPVTIAIPASDAPAMRKIVITYTTRPGAEALQWLAPEQTAGGSHPYLFSQGQPTLNRTWIPTQDSPGIRQTWEARITAPEPLTVVMSGLSLSQGGEPAGSARRAFRFAMDKPVAPYLIAIAAGDLEFRALGPRTGVWSEPSMIERSAAELDDTEKMVSAAEALYGPYRWGRYDMIVLPPAFPYGGMENPTLTFLTPTFLAGDKSLNGLVAHELAHSWSGNLVTNANWSDSWINEGVTSYFENRIMEALYGKKRAMQEAALQYDGMEEAIAAYGADADITRLHLPKDADTPDGGASGIIYDKGAIFLRTMEKIVGRQKFDAWLMSWFDRHAFQPATSALILADLRANLVKGDGALEQKLMLDAWVYEPGVPSNVWRPDPQAFADVDAAAKAYGVDGKIDAAAWKGWTTAERLRFISRLPEERSAPQLAQLDNALGLSNEGNNEVLFAWLNLALANRYDPAVPVAEEFLAHVGRRKFVAPLFRTLMEQGDWGQPIAKRIYAKTRQTYHSVTTGTVDKTVLGDS